MTATPPDDAAAPATHIVWQGVFDVADLNMQRTIEHLNLDVVRTSLIEGLASAIGVGYTLHPAHATPAEK